MTTRTAELSQRNSALIAGFGLLIMTVAAVWAYLTVFSRLIVPGDAATTTSNIMANAAQFRFMIVGFLVVIICDVVVAWALYLFFKPVHQSLSLFTAWMRLVYSIVFAMSLLGLVTVLGLTGGAGYLTAFGADQLNAQVMLSVTAFTNGWDIGYVFFGLHLALLGYLVFRSGFVPRLLGALLVLAGASYLIDRFAFYLLPNAGLNLSLFLGWGELVFMVWLLLRGGVNVEQRGNRVLGSA